MERYIPVQPLAQSGSNTGAWIFLIIFFGIIIALIIVAVIGSRKDAQEKLIENSKRRKLRDSASTNRVMLFGTLNHLITSLETELKDFKPSVGVKSLGDINKEYSDKIKDIVNSKELKDIYSLEDFRNEIKPILNELIKAKPSNWSKEASFATGLAKEKFNALNKAAKNKSELTKGETHTWK